MNVPMNCSPCSHRSLSGRWHLYHSSRVSPSWQHFLIVTRDVVDWTRRRRWTTSSFIFLQLNTGKCSTNCSALLIKSKSFYDTERYRNFWQSIFISDVIQDLKHLNFFLFLSRMYTYFEFFSSSQLNSWILRNILLHQEHDSLSVFYREVLSTSPVPQLWFNKGNCEMLVFFSFFSQQ